MQNNTNKTCFVINQKHSINHFHEGAYRGGKTLWTGYQSLHQIFEYLSSSKIATCNSPDALHILGCRNKQMTTSKQGGYSHQDLFAVS